MESSRADDPRSVVEDFNHALWTLLEERHPDNFEDLYQFMALTYVSTGETEAIEYLGSPIWDSEEGVPWDDAKDAPIMSLRDFVVAQVQHLTLAAASVSNDIRIVEA